MEACQERCINLSNGRRKNQSSLGKFRVRRIVRVVTAGEKKELLLSFSREDILSPGTSCSYKTCALYFHLFISRGVEMGGGSGKDHPSAPGHSGVLRS